MVLPLPRTILKPAKVVPDAPHLVGIFNLFGFGCRWNQAHTPSSLSSIQPFTRAHELTHTHMCALVHTLSRMHTSSCQHWTLSSLLAGSRILSLIGGGRCRWSRAMLLLLAAFPCFFGLLPPRGSQQQRGVGTFRVFHPTHLPKVHSPLVAAQPTPEPGDHPPADPSTALAPLCPGGLSPAGPEAVAQPQPKQPSQLLHEQWAATLLRQQALIPASGEGVSLPGCPQPEVAHGTPLCPPLFSQHSLVSYVTLSCFKCCVSAVSLVSPRWYTHLSYTYCLTRAGLHPHAHVLWLAQYRAA